MTEMNWIRSYGGPLICMDKDLKHSWGGTVRLTGKTNSRAENDYGRACQCDRLLGSIPLDKGDALVLGDHPLNTSFWRTTNDGLHIVRVRWVEPYMDVNDLLSSANISALPSNEIDISFIFKGPYIVIFDSVEDGTNDCISQLQAAAEGSFKISTKLFEPNDRASFYINEFKWAEM